MFREKNRQVYPHEFLEEPLELFPSEFLDKPREIIPPGISKKNWKNFWGNRWRKKPPKKFLCYLFLCITKNFEEETLNQLLKIHTAGGVRGENYREKSGVIFWENSEKINGAISVGILWSIFRVKREKFSRNV